MGVLAWILIGLVAGWLAHALLGGRGGVFGNIFEAIGLTPQSFSGSLVSATIGASSFC